MASPYAEDELIPTAGINIDTYMVVGTPPTVVPPAIETQIPDMIQVINGCVTGDRLVIHWDCMLELPYAGAGGWVDFRIRVNGVMLALNYRFDANEQFAMCSRHMSLHRIYTIPASGNYTVTVTWMYQGAFGRPQIVAGCRVLSILHIR